MESKETVFTIECFNFFCFMGCFFCISINNLDLCRKKRKNSKAELLLNKLYLKIYGKEISTISC